MSAPRYFFRLRASHSDGEALDHAEQLGAIGRAVLHPAWSEPVVGSIELDPAQVLLLDQEGDGE